MIIAIDGPAASGKSTTARLVADRLGVTYLDTGAMYRAVTLAVLENQVAFDDESGINELLTGLELDLSTNDDQTQILLSGTDVSEAIRSLKVTENVSAVSALPAVRDAMVTIQRTIGSRQDCVIEGRDIGTVVFPKAEFKFYIIADYEARAKRRLLDLEKLGEERPLDELIEDLKLRDHKDSTRDHSPLQQAEDAIVIDTSDLTIEKQVTLIVDQVKSQLNKEKMMTENKHPQQVAEETTPEAAPEVSVETPDVSAPEVDQEDTAETAPAVEPEKPVIDYLNPDIFENIKVISKRELEEQMVEEGVPQDIQQKYFNTISEISENQVISGRIIGVNEKEVLVDIGFKSEGIINRTEFGDETPKIGEKMEVFLEHLEDRSGKTVLSKEKADFMRRWREIKDLFTSEEIVKGRIVRRIKGGMVVDLKGVQAFLPGSQIDVRPVQDFDRYLDQEIDLRIVKLNETRKNIVVSHKVILEESLKEQRAALFDKIEAGQVLEGRVKNITDFGVFIDLGGIDGLLHITDLSWGRVNHPSEIVKMDDTLTVKVIDYDQEKKRVSLGLKQLSPHPWENVEEKYPIESKIQGKVVSMTNYGVFVEIEPGVEGLIHVSEMSWTRHVRNPSEIYSMGDEVEATVLSIDSEERKISLGAKQLQPDPWDEIEDRFMVGTVQNGKVINLTQFGAFVELAEGIDGLIHVSDLSWTKVIRHPKEILEKNQEVEVRVLEVSRESRRISLGLKQVSDDPWPEIIQKFAGGITVEGEIIRVLDKGIIVQLEMDVEGIIPITKFSKRDRKNIARKFKTGETIEAVVMEVKPDDKKVILFADDLGVEEKSTKKDDVAEFLDNQEAPAGEKIELPEGLSLETEEESSEDEKPKDTESKDSE